MFNKAEHNKQYHEKHYVRVPLDVKISEYNSVKEYCREQGIGVNTYIRNLLNENLPSELLEKHKDDTEKGNLSFSVVEQ
jgi:hypothetical protein